MEMWLSIIIGAAITGAFAGLAIYATGRQMGVGIGETGKYIREAVEAIHADIRGGQEKSEKELKER